MRRFVASSRAMLAVAVMSVAVGVAGSAVARDCTWLARSGAIVVAVGIALVSRFGVQGRDPRQTIGMDFGLTSLDPEYYRKAGEPIPEWLAVELRDRQAVGVLGPLVSLVGTVFWGFADLLNPMFGFEGR